MDSTIRKSTETKHISVLAHLYYEQETSAGLYRLVGEENITYHKGLT